jgi:hypothetical protein
MGLGKLQTQKSIEMAITEIKHWLSEINVSGLDLDVRYDAKINVALLRMKHNGKNYEFRSTMQSNCRLNMWAIARVMEYKVRSHLMGIETFEKSMSPYLMIEGKVENNSFNQQSTNEKSYIILGISSIASNDEIKKKYKELMKGWHPDMANSKEAKAEFEKRSAEINNAYAEIKNERGL